MPTPLRDDGTAGPAKHLLVFVHGFASDAICWSPLQHLLSKDPRFIHFDLRCYEYPTALLQLHFLRRIPRLKELGCGLRAFLEPRLRGWCRFRVHLAGESLDPRCPTTDQHCGRRDRRRVEVR